MTRTSQGARVPAELVGTYGAALHRLAAVLTADTVRATELTARTLAEEARRGDSSADTLQAADRLRASLVRHYLRSVPRRAEGVHPPGGDAGDVLRRLSPRARAASALRLLERWGPDQVARAVGTSGRRVERLVPDTPGLELALGGLADQHALSGPALVEAIDEALEDDRPTARAGHRRWWGWAAAAALPVALVLGYGVDHQRDAATARADTSAPAPVDDLSGAGWELDDDGDPPRGPMGLILRDTVTVDGTRDTPTVTVPESAGLGIAAFGVLWCDMPPAEDDHLRVPVGTLTVDDIPIELPCAGKDGGPPVSRVVPLPPGRTGVLEVSGDIPGKGGATLGLYAESDIVSLPMTSRPSGVAAPPVGDDQLVLDRGTRHETFTQQTRSVHAVTVGPDSRISIWSGQKGLVTVAVDGVPVTDDGDVAAMMAMYVAWRDDRTEWGSTSPNPDAYADWTTQQPDLRDGQWAVHVPGTTRTFALPAGVAPPPGERRTVTVEVLTQTSHDELQVSVSDADAAPLDTAPVAASRGGEGPDLVLGHRLAGRWEVPSDGHLRELEGSATLPEDVVLLGVRNDSPAGFFPWGQGFTSRGETLSPLWAEGDLDAALVALHQPWWDAESAGSGPVQVAAPAAPGRPLMTVLAYAPVPYEDYDFAAAAPPPQGSDGMWFFDPARDPLAVLGPEDMEGGRVTTSLLSDTDLASSPLAGGTGLAARITTEGAGRIRFLVDGRPTDALGATDGWWSSWTAEHVTSQLMVAYGGLGRPGPELTVVVEDYEDFTIELFPG